LDHYLHLAKVYDEMMADVDYKAWAGYLHAVLEKNGVKKLFEAACGSGNITFELSSHGYDITASDNSAAMLSIAKKKNTSLCAEVRFVLQDMRAIETAGSVDAVISACDGPNYIDSQGLEMFTGSAYKALRSGGVLLFDISSQYKLETTLGGNVYFDETDDTVCIWKNTYSETDKSLEMDVTIFARQGELFERQHETHKQYAHSRNDIETILTGAGFRDILVYECFTFDEPKPDCQRLQFICRKD
jgi:SAM-dependent methyltransferase